MPSTDRTTTEPHVTRDELREALSPDAEVSVHRTRAALSARPAPPERAPAWDWSAEIGAEPDRAELEELRAERDELASKLDETRAKLESCSARRTELRAALTRLSRARFWNRRGLIDELRDRKLID